MDSQVFDSIARRFAARRLTRRQALQAGTGLAAGTLAVGLTASSYAQDATPVTGTPAAGGDDDKLSYLFVQSFSSGSLAPKSGEVGTYVLSLQGAHGRTIAFSDRPERLVASVPMDRFLESLGFTPDNPPNAALAVEPSEGETNIIVVELTNPQYDSATQSLTYDAKVLDSYQSEHGLTFQETPTVPDATGTEFGEANLFIDDCPDLVRCVRGNSYVGAMPPPSNGRIGQCYQANPFIANFGCLPQNCGGGQTLDYWNQQCNSYYAGNCGGQCNAN